MSRRARNSGRHRARWVRWIGRTLVGWIVGLMLLGWRGPRVRLCGGWWGYAW